ncbi:MAG TPA: ribonuclease HII [Thiothrix sp.]|nr:ribonuclease HII [Thiothrix sp.]
MSTWKVAGVDEVGRGALASDVVAAAVILDPQHIITGLMDSKRLSPTKRETLAAEIKEKALSWHIAQVSAAMIDRVNILQASLLAMKKAVEGLSILPDEVLIDGKQCPDLAYPMTAIIKGDNSEPAIAAASIIAKVYRDAQMIALDADYPMYGFAKHKGYPTQQHLEALTHHGASEIHRRSFAPVAKVLQRG